MSDSITNIRWAIRGILSEGVQPHDVIIMAALPGESESDTRLKVVGFDKAMARQAKGFGTEGDKELGKWEYVGLPERSATGRADAPPWVMFMDWLWDFLRDIGLDPQPAEGFGDEKPHKPGEKLSVHAKRAKKYGAGVSIPMASREEIPPGFEKSWSKFKGAWTGTPGEKEGEKRYYKERGEIPGGGYDINRDITIIVNSLGDDQEERAKKFDQLLKNAKTPDWFKIVPDIDKKGDHNYRWFVRVNIDVAESEGWKERLSSITAYKAENRDKWKAAINDLAAGKTNPIQLVPIVIAYLVEVHNFKRPFHIDMLNEQEFNKALKIVQDLTLNEIVEFARKTKRVPPVVGADISSQKPSAMDHSQLVNRWNQIVAQLAGESGVDQYAIQVALVDYIEAQPDFSKPFDIDTARPAELSNAIVKIGTLKYEDIAGLVESVNNYVDTVINEDMHPILDAMLMRAALRDKITGSTMIGPHQVDVIFDNGKKVQFQYSASGGYGSWMAYIEGGPDRWYDIASSHGLNSIKTILGY